MNNVKYYTRSIALSLLAVSIIALILTGGTAFAQSSGAIAGSKSTSGAIAGSQAGAVGVGGSAGSHSSSANQNIVGSGNTYEAPDYGDHVPTMFIPNLTTSNGTCANSFTVGGSGAGFGVAFAKTYVSGPCNARFTSNQLNALGHTELALEVMCSIKAVAEADIRYASQYGTVPKCAQEYVPSDELSMVDDDNELLDDGVVGEPAVIWFDDKSMTEVNDLVSAEMEASEAKTWGYEYEDTFTNQ